MAALHEPYLERFPCRVAYIQAFYGAARPLRPLYTNRTFRGVAGIRRSLKNRCWSHGAGAQGLNNIRRSGRWGAEQSSEDNNYVIVQNTAALHEPYVERFPFRVSYIQAFYGAARRFRCRTDCASTMASHSARS